MFNNVALDVVIGLVLVYLLYSLLVTILGEMVGTWFGLRPRILRIAIERMLNDGLDAKQAKKTNSIFSSTIAKFFLKEPPGFSKSLAGKFYEYPSIKYLAKLESSQALLFGQTKPSYITADNFSNTVINILSDNGKGADKLTQIAFCLQFNPLRIEPESIKHLRNLYNLSNGTLDGFKAGLVAWYNETMDRANGWYKRKLSLILFWLGFLIAVTFNVDSIKIARLLSKDKEARNQLVTMGVALTKDTGRYAGYVHAGKDSVHKQSVIDTGFAHVSKDITAANLVLGLGWNFGNLKQDELEINGRWTSYLWYSILLKRCNDSINAIGQVIKAKKYIIQGIKNEMQAISRDTLTRKVKLSSLSGSRKADSANALAQGIASIKKSNSNIGAINLAIKKDSVRLEPYSTLINRIRDSVNKRNDKNYVSIQSITFSASQNNTVITGKKLFGFWAKIRYFFGTTFGSLSFLGFLITGFALSLGAPFWFGVLNKLVSIRGSGVKPEDKSTDQPASSGGSAVAAVLPAASANLLSTDAIATAVDELNHQYQNFSGVLSIGAGYMQTDGKKRKAIEIHAISQEVIDTLKKQIGGGAVYNNIPINFMINTRVVAHLACGDKIRNQAIQKTWGTLGCLARKEGDDSDYLLSCWHVLQRARDQVQTLNINNIAEIIEGDITDTLDVGFAKLATRGQLDNNAIGIQNQYRAVTFNDAVHEAVVRFTGGASVPTEKPIVIYNDAVDPQSIYNEYTESNYTLSDMFSITSYDDNHNFVSPSQKGDSGAIIVDSNGYPLGILVAGDSNFTYAVKLTNVFDPESKKSFKQYSIPH